MGVTEKYQLWKNKVKDRKLSKELIRMPEDEMKSAFYKELEFGTAGIRGIMGAGTNRLNIYTIRKITQGIVLYMKENDMEKAVISYDSRINSQLFANEAAAVFAAAGISVFITPALMPTPFLSYAVSKLGADIGIMITASHNPREYNGYKVYDGSGCQILDETAMQISEIIRRIDAFRIRVHSFEYYRAKGLIEYTSEELEEDYIKEILSIHPGRADGLKVVYTPLNGTGYRLVPRVLKEIGCEVATVHGQDEPSGKFASCQSPNPEKREALRLGIRMLKETGADILIATDPDADRIGIAFMSGGEVFTLSGNDIGALMSEYLLSSYCAELRPLIVRTAVSTPLVDKIAEKFGADVEVVPTGFKYIGNVINELADKSRFLLGFEESQGYLVGTHARDKDAVIASKIMAMIAADCLKKGMTLDEKLKALHKEFGNYEHRQFTFRFEGEEGEAKMKIIMESLRIEPPQMIASKQILSRIDYLYRSKVDFPPLNMLQYNYEGGSVIIRPSGTEPLIKVYVCSHLSSEANEKVFRQVKKQFNELFA